jgi:signal transduction histidine kinase
MSPLIDKELEYNLLVVDDEVEITKSLVRQFRGKYNVYAATNVSDAFPILENKNIHVVISDQRMPGITGVDFFSRIKDKYPDAQKLILTGYSDIEAVIGAINEGQIFRYLTKPWNPAELDSVIKEAFDKHELITNNRRLLRKLQETNLNLEEKVKERTTELESANETLTRLNLEKNKYVGMVAHDLRNPIGAAHSFSNLLLEERRPYSQEERKKFLKIINERCNFALNLIGGFLDVSKIEAGIFELHPNEYDYVNFVNENINQNIILAENKSQLIRFETDLKELNFTFDKDKIEQVLNNLISNAVKYSFPNTTITIGVSIVNNQVITRVKDQGQGIPARELKDIFMPYKISSVKTTANEKSTGLGLAIVKKIIDVHGGTISVESEVGSGSVFTYVLPVTQKNKSLTKG